MLFLQHGLQEKAVSLLVLGLNRIDRLAPASLYWLTTNFGLKIFPRHSLQHKTLGTKWDDVSNWTSTGSAASGSCFSPSTTYKIKKKGCFFFLSLTLPPLRLKRMDKLTATSLCWLNKNFRPRFFPRHGLQHPTLGSTWDDVNSWTSTGSAESGSCFSPSMACKKKTNFLIFLFLKVHLMSPTSLNCLENNPRLRFFPKRHLQHKTLLGGSW